MKLSPPLPQRLSLALQDQLSEALGLQQSGQLDQAYRAFEAVLEQVPDHPETLHLLGLLAARRGDPAWAAELLARAIAGQPANAESHRGLGLALVVLGRLDQALAAFDRAITLAPHGARTHFNRANLLVLLGRPDDALAGFEQSLRLYPRDPETSYNFAVALNASRRPTEALALLDELVASHPTFARGQNLRGIILMQMCRPVEACDCFESAKVADPTFADAHNNFGSALRELGQHEAALAAYRHALALRPDFAEAHWNIGVALLLLGDFAAGWAGYEWRKQVDPTHFQTRIPFATWNGDVDIAGRSIFVRCEQGFGDTLQFCRYATALHQRGALVVLSVQSPLRALLDRVLVGVTVIDEQDSPPDCDFFCDLLSLPRAFRTNGTTVPTMPWPITPSPGHQRAWQRRLGPGHRSRIGIAWSGNPKHTNDHSRSIPLAMWRSLIAHDAEWVAVQKDLRETDAEVLKLFGRVSHFGEDLQDFDDTAALIAMLDIVITVDTSVAHLAAAMGKPVWLLLAFTPDWRWLIDRAETPWYPSIRPFRQPRPGDWPGVLAEVGQALAALTNPTGDLTNFRQPGACGKTRPSAPGPRPRRVR